MKASANCIKLIEGFEGLVLKSYQDEKGIWTIGLGTTVYPNGKKVTKNDPAISKEMAYDLALIHVGKDEIVAKKLIKCDLEQHQFDAIMAFIYNAGTTQFRTSTLLKLININPKDPKIWGAFLLFDKIKIEGEFEKSKGLFRRRNAEAHLYFKNEINFYTELL